MFPAGSCVDKHGGPIKDRQSYNRKKTMKSGNVDHSIVINERVREPVSQLCANLYLGQGAAPGILAVTSAEAGEGRTSLTLALGLEVASTLGAKTLVIEANFRSPGMGKLAGLSNDSQGLADVLYRNANVESLIHSLGQGAPDVLTAGNIETGPFSPLVSRDKIENIIRTLAGKYQYVIIETPPINLYPESSVLVSIADGVILTIKAGVTSRETVQLATKKMEIAGAKFLGMVLNRKQYHLPEWLYRRL
jgi:capsular exopolysaccharide synthesis family protein